MHLISVECIRGELGTVLLHHLNPEKHQCNINEDLILETASLMKSLGLQVRGRTYLCRSGFPWLTGGNNHRTSGTPM